MTRQAEVPTKIKLIVIARSAGICNFGGCNKILDQPTPADGDIHLYETAHVYPLADEGPRGVKGAKIPIAKKNAPENLILLCPNHHTQVDKAPKSHPVDSLRVMKRAMEEKIAAVRNLATADVTFAELDAVCERFVADPAVEQAPGTLTRTEIDAKMLKNELSGITRLALTNGISIASRVRDYVSAETSNDSTFPDRLKFGFRKHYYALLHDGVKGDDLFERLSVIASGGVLAGSSRRAAGQAVLSYLFELCEVFEP